MIEDHIADGDLVIVEPRNAARDGEIVVAVLEGEATLKRLYREGPDMWRLQPANASMSPILVRPPQRLEIRGVVRGVLRRY
jgi:repressor LexA